MSRRIISIILSFCFLFTQTGFAQVAAVELNLAGHLARLGNSLAVEAFRPVHLRYFSYDTLNNTFKVLLDKGDYLKGLSPQGTVPEEKLKQETKALLNYFLIGLTLPNDFFWVNLRPDSEDSIIEDRLSLTDVGRIMLEADLQLKKDTASFTSPNTPEGRLYWDKLYKKAEELYGYQSVEIPTLTRPWIVPGEIIVRETNPLPEGRGNGEGATQPSAYIYKATLKVMLESDYLKNSSNPINSTNYSFKDERSKALNEYSSQLIRELIIPKLTKEVNTSKKYASLRQVYYSLILSRWFKSHFKGLSPQGTDPNFVNLIDSKDLTNLTSKIAWDKSTYFQAYKKSFTGGEYNLKEPHYTPTGQVIRSYMSGGANLMSPMQITGISLGDNIVSSPMKAEPPVPEGTMLVNVRFNDGLQLDLVVDADRRTYIPALSGAVEHERMKLGPKEQKLIRDLRHIKRAEIAKASGRGKLSDSEKMRLKQTGASSAVGLLRELTPLQQFQAMKALYSQEGKFGWLGRDFLSREVYMSKEALFQFRQGFFSELGNDVATVAVDEYIEASKAKDRYKVRIDWKKLKALENSLAIDIASGLHPETAEIISQEDTKAWIEAGEVIRTEFKAITTHGYSGRVFGNISFQEKDKSISLFEAHIESIKEESRNDVRRTKILEKLRLERERFFGTIDFLFDENGYLLGHDDSDKKVTSEHIFYRRRLFELAKLPEFQPLSLKAEDKVAQLNEETATLFKVIELDEEVKKYMLEIISRDQKGHYRTELEISMVDKIVKAFIDIANILRFWGVELDSHKLILSGGDEFRRIPGLLERKAKEIYRNYSNSLIYKKEQGIGQKTYSDAFREYVSSFDRRIVEKIAINMRGDDLAIYVNFEKIIASVRTFQELLNLTHSFVLETHSILPDFAKRSEDNPIASNIRQGIKKRIQKIAVPTRNIFIFTGPDGVVFVQVRGYGHALSIMARQAKEPAKVLIDYKIHRVDDISDVRRLRGFKECMHYTREITVATGAFICDAATVGDELADFIKTVPKTLRFGLVFFDDEQVPEEGGAGSPLSAKELGNIHKRLAKELQVLVDNSEISKEVSKWIKWNADIALNPEYKLPREAITAYFEIFNLYIVSLVKNLSADAFKDVERDIIIQSLLSAIDKEAENYFRDNPIVANWQEKIHEPLRDLAGVIFNRCNEDYSLFVKTLENIAPIFEGLAQFVKTGASSAGKKKSDVIGVTGVVVQDGSIRWPRVMISPVYEHRNLPNYRITITNVEEEPKARRFKVMFIMETDKDYCGDKLEIKCGFYYYRNLHQLERYFRSVM